MYLFLSLPVAKHPGIREAVRESNQNQMQTSKDSDPELRLGSRVQVPATLRKFVTCTLSVLLQGERLSHAVGCAFAACLERKQRREKECGVTASFDASRTSFVREGSFRANSTCSQQGGSSERDDKLPDKKKGTETWTQWQQYLYCVCKMIFW